ncbi:Zinc finger, RING-type [Corchorus olitorius]|uniref:Zinc finger, RING-type n=1 Tax=Corchorus olitorius TaxID=93759 RepID=A0A1R3IC16_9ROSI|nr:Zinc finger, RING-type [Corchorus olitorius]
MAMAMALLSLLFVTIAFVSIFRNYFPSFIRRSTIFSYVTLAPLRLGWAMEFLYCYCLYPNYNYVPNYMPENGGAGGGYHWKEAASTDVEDECPVCLFKVQEGEEIGELRCGHVCHRFCLETWIQYGKVTCPLCRGLLAPSRLEVVAVQEVRLLLVEFCANCHARDRNRWWLR